MSFGDWLRNQVRLIVQSNLRGGGTVDGVLEERRKIKEEDRLQAVEQECRRQEAQAAQWERKFRDGRSPDLKIRCKYEKGYTDIYYGGQRQA